MPTAHKSKSNLIRDVVTIGILGLLGLIVVSKLYYQLQPRPNLRQRVGARKEASQTNDEPSTRSQSNSARPSLLIVEACASRRSVVGRVEPGVSAADFAAYILMQVTAVKVN